MFEILERKKLQELRSSNRRWAVLFASFLTFLAFAFVFQLMPPLLTRVADEFTVDEVRVGLLMSLTVIPGIILALPTGLVVNKYGFRWLGFVSLLLVASGSLVTALAQSFALTLLGRFILGVGGAFIVVGVPTIIPQWFGHKELGKAMGLYGTNMPVATILAFPTATVLAQNFNDWRYPFYVGSVLAVLVAVVFVAVVREGPMKGERTPIGLTEVKKAVRNSEIWKASLVWMFFNAAAIAYLSWAKVLFETFKGLQPIEASIFASVLMYAAVVFVPLFGWASDKTERRKPFLVVGSIAMALALIVTSFSSGLMLVVSVILLGIAAASVPPVVMTIPPQNSPPNLAGTAFSIVTLCQNIGIAFSAPYAGYLIQTTQHLPSIFLGISLFPLVAAAAALTLKTK